MLLTDNERLRYARHLALPEIGEWGQKRVRKAQVAVVGLGGLGGPACLALAAAGIGRLILFERDRVEASNLPRQTLYTTNDVGAFKLDVAMERLLATQPEITLLPMPEGLTAKTDPHWLDNCDVIVDASDNPETRYLCNEISVRHQKPLAYASVSQFEGQATFFEPGETACLNCVFPRAERATPLLNCAEQGVLSTLPGIIALIQATEVLKFLLKIRPGLQGRLLRLDARSLKFSELAFSRDPQCHVCGSQEANKHYPTKETVLDFPGEISCEELKARWDKGEKPFLLDVREPDEYSLCHLGGTLIPLGDLTNRASELDPQAEIIVYCHHGVRSRHAVAFLRHLGFGKARNLTGGIDRWSLLIDPTVRRY